MNKKVIFIGMHDKHMASSHMKALIGELVMKGVSVWKKNKYDFVFETPNAYIRYVCSGDKSVDLIGLRADAVFGSIYDSMMFHMKPGAEQWMELNVYAFDYIYNLELDALWISTRDINGKRTNHYVHWDEVCKYVQENFTDEDEILFVVVADFCIFSYLANNRITIGDLLGFFA